MKPILEIKSVTKKFRLLHEQQPYLSLRDSLMKLFKRNGSTQEEFLALDNVSFNVMPGDSIGIIGKNGAGKSTLLKVLSQITPPSEGRIIVRGRIASLLEVGTGFHLELTGRENVYFNGSILGMKRAEITRKFDEIVDFSGTEKFLDTPLKHFSTGMQLRLAFSVAAFLDPEILVIDEVLAVGDAEFQKKCLGKMEDIGRTGRTILFVSHNMGSVAQLCPKSILLEKGRILSEGRTEQVIDKYIHESRLSGDTYSNAEPHPGQDIRIASVFLSDPEGNQKNYFTTKEPVILNFRLAIMHHEEEYSLFVTILNKFKNPVFTAETKITGEEYRLKIHDNFLTDGIYSIAAVVHIVPYKRSDAVNDICTFQVSDQDSAMMIYNNSNYFYGSVFGNYSWLD
ncbi:MAG TPA: ABC transporter ATP-binding protein [Bacteroidia bacterium]|nr:ABC transporter ATP-binding protein [Bacteroidia bacterium]